jgi:hypothetical protein
VFRVALVVATVYLLVIGQSGWAIAFFIILVLIIL